MTINKKAGNIILLGFMGSGKSSVGKILAINLDRKFIDLDQEIEKTSGMTISNIFISKGESHFRELEKKAISSLKSCSETIISIGGGAFCNKENIKALKEAGTTVYLKSNISSLLRRYTEEERAKRPLLTNMDKLGDLIKSREKYYKQASITIETDNKNIEEIKDEIISLLDLKKS